jgi:hypothetical protein
MARHGAMQDRCSASQPATASADPAATMQEFFTSTHWALQVRRSGLGPSVAATTRA